MNPGQPSLLRRLRWIFVVAWIVAAIRLGLDLREQDDPVIHLGAGIGLQLSIGVYYVMPFLLLIGALRGTFDGLSYKQLVLAMLVIGVLCWGIPNTITYGIAQFNGWQHGRFSHAADRGPPIAATTLGKIGYALMVGGFTSIGGFVWNFLMMHLLVLWPRKKFRPAGGRLAATVNKPAP
jgi:hypothetical protein